MGFFLFLFVLQVDGKWGVIVLVFGCCGQYQCFYFGYCLFEVDEQGVGDDGVVDVQFVDVVDGCDWFDIVVVQVMFGVDDQVEGMFEGYVFVYLLQFMGLFFGVFGVGVVIGMQFDSWCVDLGGGFDLLWIGIDEQ